MNRAGPILPLLSRNLPFRAAEFALFAPACLERRLTFF